MLSRRGFIKGAALALAAPAIIRQGICMPIRPVLADPTQELLNMLDMKIGETVIVCSSGGEEWWRHNGTLWVPLD